MERGKLIETLKNKVARLSLAGIICEIRECDHKITFILKGHRDVSRLVLPEGVESFFIEDVNINIDKLIMPNSLEEITEYTFKDTKGIKYIKLGNKCRKIGYKAFLNSDVRNVELNDGLEDIQYEAFRECLSLSEIIIPDSVKNIGHSAFRGCKSLVKVKLSKRLKRLDSELFAQCESLEGIQLPEGLEEIMDNVFFGCRSMEKLVIPESVTKLGEEIAGCCFKMREVTLPKGITWIEEKAFVNCEELQKIDIPNTVEIIGYGAFKGCKKLNNIVIPESVKEIHGYAFLNTGLKETMIPEGCYCNIGYCFPIDCKVIRKKY